MLQAYGVTDPGSVRQNNEDYFLVLPDRGLYILADGMGGAQAGEHASKLAADTVSEVLAGKDKIDAADLGAAFEEANRRVLAEASTDLALEGMGTTLIAAVENGPELLIASVGDSRAYVYQEGQLLAVTEDQTWVHEVGRRLGIDEASLQTHPMRHVLTMAIGVSPQLRIHAHVLTPQNGTLVLLCSDGLHGVVNATLIAETLADSGNLESKGKRLIEAAKKAGGPDNVTAVLLRCYQN